MSIELKLRINEIDEVLMVNGIDEDLQLEIVLILVLLYVQVLKISCIFLTF